MNRLKKIFFKVFLIRGVNRRYVATPALKEVLVPMKSRFLIACPINIDLLEMQYRSIMKNVEDAFDYLVVDTSTKEDQAKATEEFCAKNNISYVRPLKNPGTDASLKHGFTLNWTFYN